MYSEKLEQGIRDFFHTEVKRIEPPREWWNNAVSRLNEEKHRERSWFVPKTRLAWLLVPLILLVIGGAVYGATLLFREFFWEHVEEAGLAEELNLSQTIDGVTVTLERAYADANVVLIGYTISGPTLKYHSDVGSLTTIDGQILPAMVSVGDLPDPNIMGDWHPSERLAIIAAYDTSSLTGTSSELHLKLETQVADSPITGESQVFTFEFSVLFHAGKVVTSGQTVESAGVLITLEKVIITPWATRTIFRFQPNEHRYLPVISLKLPDGDVKNAWLIGDKGTSSEQMTIGDFTKLSGEWEVIVNELVIVPGATEQEGGAHPAGNTKRIIGPWIFRFQVP